LSIPSELKKITAFVRRAEELDLDRTSPESRLVAYYCRQYAVQMGIPLASSSAAAKKCLGELLAELEREKPVMDNFSRTEAALLCRKFANKVFDKADVEDRTGNATKGTARTFYAAASFLQILEQFSEADGDDVEFAEDKKKVLYSKWKSTEILKALTEGRTPTPGGYGSDVANQDRQAGGEIEAQRGSAPVETVSGNSSDADDDHREHQQPTAVDPPDLPDIPQAPFMYPISDLRGSTESTVATSSDSEIEEAGTEVSLNGHPAPPPPSYNFVSKPSVPNRPPVSFDISPPEPPVVPILPPTPTAAPSIGSFFGFGNGNKAKKQISKSQLTDAIELTRFALAALEDRDTDIAAERLQQALTILR
jgi:vacuolar protein sorting-associated protein VTA1